VLIFLHFFISKSGHSSTPFLIDCSLAQCLSISKLSAKVIHDFLGNPADKQTDWKNRHENYDYTSPK